MMRLSSHSDALDLRGRAQRIRAESMSLAWRIVYRKVSIISYKKTA
jgi:hypothetical protein